MNRFVKSIPFGNTGIFLKPEFDYSALKNNLSDPYFPFKIINDSTPYIRVVEAKIVTDTGSHVKSVMLFMQKDDSLEKNAITNIDIENCWQQLYSSFTHSHDNFVLTLSVQIKSDKSLIPFKPLFYCTQMKQFFHPPCPECGHPLSLCTDDTILRSAGLASYFKSKKRYLFCESCKPSNIYTTIKEMNAHPIVKNRNDLITAFKNIKKECELLPCRNCPLEKDCFTKSLYLTRIRVFSFYPFYMLIINDSSKSCHYWTSFSILYFNQLLSGERNHIFQQLNTIQTDIQNRFSKTILEKEALVKPDNSYLLDKKLYQMISNIKTKWQNKSKNYQEETIIFQSEDKNNDQEKQADSETNTEKNLISKSEKNNVTQNEQEWDCIPQTRIDSTQDTSIRKNTIKHQKKEQISKKVYSENEDNTHLLNETDSEWDNIPATKITSPEKIFQNSVKDHDADDNSEWDEIPPTTIKTIVFEDTESKKKLIDGFITETITI